MPKIQDYKEYAIYKDSMSGKYYAQNTDGEKIGLFLTVAETVVTIDNLDQYKAGVEPAPITFTNPPDTANMAVTETGKGVEVNGEPVPTKPAQSTSKKAKVAKKTTKQDTTKGSKATKQKKTM